MTAAVETMMYVGETPWHGLGTRLEEAPTTEQAIVAAGLDWDVELVPTWYELNGVRHATDSRVVVRSSDGAQLGEVGSKWRPLQNREAFAWFDPFIESGAATIETAGSLWDGKRVWALARLEDVDPIVPKADDTVARYLLLSNGHDGHHSVRVGFTPIRVVCNNTLAAAHANAASKLLKVRHTSGMVDTLAAVSETMSLVAAEFEATAADYRALARKRVGAKKLEEYVERVFPGNKSAVAKVTELAETGIGADLVGVRGTMWGAYNAVTEYLSWQAGRTQDRRLDSLWFGRGAQINERALTEGLLMAGGAR